MAELRNSRQYYEREDKPTICLEEVIIIMSKLKKRKATPATDRVPNEAVKYILEAVGH